MQIIISPAKKMRDELDSLAPRSQPVFGQEAGQLAEWLKSLSYEELKERLSCSEASARQNYERYQKMDLTKNLSPAILSYEGIQYQYMAPAVFEEEMLSWVQSHLRILSGFYGVLKPMDGVTPYRLEMQARLSAGGSRDLYDFWGSRICEEICAGDADSGEPAGVIINLASKEYSRCVERFLRPETRFITCIFGEWSGGKIAQKGTYAKMARGEMVRFLAERRAESPEEAKKFDRLGYVFDEEHSDNTSWVFIRTEE